MTESLYDDLFQVVKINENLGRNKFYSHDYLNIIDKNDKIQSKLLKNLFNLFEESNLKHSSSKLNILFWDLTFLKIIKEQSDFFNIFIFLNSFRKYYSFRKSHGFQRGIAVHFIHHEVSLLNKAFLTHREEFAEKAIAKIQNYLLKHDIRLIVLGNDKLFEERLLIKSAEHIHVPVVIIQHGIYTEDSFTKLKTADSAENFWVWSNYVKDLYKSCYVDKRAKISVIGYPYDIPNVDDSVLKPCVLFLGNQYFNFNKEEGKGYISIAVTVKNICQENNLSFVYRPHPAEIMNKDIKEYNQLLPYISKNKNLWDDLKKANIVIGDISSAMVEAGLAGRKVIQIIWSERSNVALKDPIYSFTYKVNANYNNIKKAIEDCLNSSSQDFINDYYFWYDPEFKTNIHNLILDLV